MAQTLKSFWLAWKLWLRMTNGFPAGAARITQPPKVPERKEVMLTATTTGIRRVARGSTEHLYPFLLLGPIMNLTMQH
jgi:hypothetical protein